MRLGFNGLGFHTLDINSGSVINLYVPKPQPKAGIIPLNVIHHNGNRLLLHDCESPEQWVEVSGVVAFRLTLTDITGADQNHNACKLVGVS